MDYRRVDVFPEPTLRPYAPRRFPGPRAAWTPAAVIVALRDWTREWGTPPRREHWTGSHPAAAGAAQRKWTLAPVALDEFAPAVIDDDAARRGALSI